MALPFYIIWGIWRVKRTQIFEYEKPKVCGTYIKFFTCFLEIGPTLEKATKISYCPKDLVKNSPIGFLMGHHHFSNVEVGCTFS